MHIGAVISSFSSFYLGGVKWSTAITSRPLDVRGRGYQNEVPFVMSLCVYLKEQRIWQINVFMKYANYSWTSLKSMDK